MRSHRGLTQPVVRSGLAIIIQYTMGIEVVAEASTGTEAVRLFNQHQPDVVLMDLRMPEVSDRTQAVLVALKRGIANL